MPAAVRSATAWRGLRPDRVGDDEDARGVAVDRDPDGDAAARARIAGRGEQGRLVRWPRSCGSSSRRSEPDEHGPAVDHRRDAVPGERLERRRRVRNPSSSRLASVDDRARPAGARCRARRTPRGRRHRARIDAGAPRRSARPSAGPASASRSCRTRPCRSRPAVSSASALRKRIPASAPATRADHDRGRRREAHRARAGDDHDADERR